MWQDFVTVLSLMQAPLFICTQGNQGPDCFSEMQSESTDKQGPDKELMTYNDAAEQILTLARIRAEFKDPEQTKAQLLIAVIGENDVHL
ncbi:MAG: hypothetical protein EZS28_042019 [Streblomastix strix]|uniref:Uncharacterized protein n=1 Tax=Streblomastix strix TaxID=222440 RepID=A0A5J4TX11_9EUKA|nr:MAG: hypothetical protein EZS28_042019 [Streblomastix strix]